MIRTNSINPYCIRLEIVNKDKIASEYTQVSSMKRRDYVTKYKNTIKIGREFVKKLLNEL